MSKQKYLNKREINDHIAVIGTQFIFLFLDLGNIDTFTGRFLDNVNQECINLKVETKEFRKSLGAKNKSWTGSRISPAKVVSYQNKKYNKLERPNSQIDILSQIKNGKTLSYKMLEINTQREIPHIETAYDTHFNFLTQGELTRKLKMPKTEKKKKRSEISNLGDFRKKITYSKSKYRIAHSGGWTSKNKSSKRKKSKAGISSSIFATQASSQTDFAKKSSLHSRPKSIVDFSTFDRRSAYNVIRPSNPEFRYSYRPEPKDNMNPFKSRTSIKEEIKIMNYSSSKKFVKHKIGKVSDLDLLASKLAATFGHAQKRNSKVSKKQKSWRSLVKVNPEPGTILRPKEVLKIPDRYSNVHLSIFQNSRDATSNMMWVSNMEGSQEKTIIDFINNRSDKTMEKSDNLINTNDSFEPSVADEVEYEPPQESTTDIDWTIGNLEVNEGTNEYNTNLVNRVKLSQFDSVQILPGSKIKTSFLRHMNDYKHSNNIEMINRVDLKANMTPKIIQSSLKPRIPQRYIQEEEIGQQGSSLIQTQPKSLNKIRSMSHLTASSLQYAKTKSFANKFNS